MGAIGDASVISVLEEYSKDPVTEVAETCQLALERLKWLEKSKQSSEELPENPYASVDPAPPMSISDVDNLRKHLLDENASLFDRYRAMFTLRNLRTEESVLALAAGKVVFIYLQKTVVVSLLPLFIGVCRSESWECSLQA